MVFLKFAASSFLRILKNHQVKKTNVGILKTLKRINLESPKYAQKPKKANVKNKPVKMNVPLIPKSKLKVMSPLEASSLCWYICVIGYTAQSIKLDNIAGKYGLSIK